MGCQRCMEDDRVATLFRSRWGYVCRPCAEEIDREPEEPWVPAFDYTTYAGPGATF